jgi:hypothetical protein
LWKALAKAFELVAIDVIPDAQMAKPTRYERNGSLNARLVTYAAPAARG